MILFLDTSALVKLYVREEFSDEVCVLAEEARVLAVSRISWAETMAALRGACASIRSMPK